jgi:hypothetical protein
MSGRNQIVRTADKSHGLSGGSNVKIGQTHHRQGFRFFNPLLADDITALKGRVESQRR